MKPKPTDADTDKTDQTQENCDSTAATSAGKVVVGVHYGTDGMAPNASDRVTASVEDPTDAI